MTMTALQLEPPESAGSSPLAELFLSRAQMCQEIALAHRERGAHEIAARLEGKAWGYREAARHLDPGTDRKGW